MRGCERRSFVVDIEAFARRESMLRLRENLVAVEEERLSGKKGYSIDEVSSMMKKSIRDVANGNRS